jgi:hypothetical protein
LESEEHAGVCTHTFGRINSPTEDAGAGLTCVSVVTTIPEAVAWSPLNPWNKATSRAWQLACMHPEPAPQALTLHAVLCVAGVTWVAATPQRERK